MSNTENSEYYNVVRNREREIITEQNDSVEEESVDGGPSSKKIPRLANPLECRETRPQKRSPLQGYGSDLNISYDLVSQYSNPGQNEGGTCSEHAEESREDLQQNEEEQSHQAWEQNNGSSTLIGTAPIARLPDFNQGFQNESLTTFNLLLASDQAPLGDTNDNWMYEEYCRSLENSDLSSFIEGQSCPNPETVNLSTTTNDNFGSTQQAQLSTEPQSVLITNRNSFQASSSGQSTQQRFNPGPNKAGTCSEHDVETREVLQQNEEEASHQGEALEQNGHSNRLTAVVVAHLPDFDQDIQNEDPASNSLPTSAEAQAQGDQIGAWLEQNGIPDDAVIEVTIIQGEIPLNQESMTTEPFTTTQDEFGGIQPSQSSTKPLPVVITDHNSFQASSSRQSIQNAIDITQHVEHANNASHHDQSTSNSAVVTGDAVAAPSLICRNCRRNIEENCIYGKLDGVLKVVFAIKENLMPDEKAIVTTCGKCLLDALFDDDEIATPGKLDWEKRSILSKFLAWVLQSEPPVQVKDRTIDKFKEFVNASSDIKLLDIHKPYLNYNVLIKYRSERRKAILKKNNSEGDGEGEHRENNE